ncbi:hypothetical protein BN903_30 [Halorubrum sp. AJ67]|nr:hypothetical protein BN903_30 [Halorubrum sp. AJ67]
MALVEVEVVEDRVGQLLGDRVGGHRLGALRARLAVDTDAEFDLVVAQIEGRLALLRGDTGGERGAHRPDVVDHLLGDACDLVEVGPLRGLRAGGLVDEDRPADAPAAGGVQRVLDGHVVVHHDACDLDALHLREFDGGLEVHHVALVVFDHREDAVARVAGPDQFLELVGGRRGEHVARGRPVEHPVADVPRVGRLVTAPPPVTIPTFPSTGPSSRTSTWVSGSRRSRSGCAAVIPSSISSTTSSGSLISFFMYDRTDSPGPVKRSGGRGRRRPSAVSSARRRACRTPDSGTRPRRFGRRRGTRGRSRSRRRRRTRPPPVRCRSTRRPGRRTRRRPTVSARRSGGPSGSARRPESRPCPARRS